MSSPLFSIQVEITSMMKFISVMKEVEEHDGEDGGGGGLMVSVAEEGEPRDRGRRGMADGGDCACCVVRRDGMIVR
ncbi:unnamed protein product [Linum trigynum]|uniref:Uncharacterized protein n=1 Tax=Linum trigynum TaxID=586398 RepID=A0AAV2CS11_9ROSI